MRLSTATALDIEPHCGPQAYDAAGLAWLDLFGRLDRPSPFLSHGWHAAWWRTVGSGTPELLVVRDGKRTVGLGPFVRLDDGRLMFSGDDLTDILDVLAEGPDVVDAIARCLSTRASVIELRFIPEASHLMRVLPDRLSRAGFAVETGPLVASPRVRLPRSFEAFVASLSKKHRHELRRKQRRLAAAGSVDFRRVRGGPITSGMDRFVAFHRSSPGEKGTFLTEPRERFFREIAEAGARDGWLYLADLCLDEAPIATLFGIEHDGTLAAYNSAVDSRFSSLSPGVLLHAHAIRDAIERGLRTYDFLRGNERYKYELGGADRFLWQISAWRAA